MRLNFSFLLIVTLLALTEDVVSQPQQKVHRIAWIESNGSKPPRDFITELRERGYVEGQSLLIDYRSAHGSEKRLAEIITELVHLNPEVIVTSGNEATRAVSKEIRKIPVVFMHGDPISDGIAQSLARPGDNLTGLSEVKFELAGKRLELLRDAFPKISRAAVLFKVDAPIHKRQFADIQRVAKALGVQLLPLDSTSDLNSVFQQAMGQRVNAFLALQGPKIFRERMRILDFAAKNRLPAMYPSRGFTEVGGLMSYGPNQRASYLRVAYYVDRILKGTKPSDLPVEQPTKFELVINLNTAKTLGLTIPPKVLTWADRVIE